ncbi:MAG: calcium/sodium antiporter [Candidatus Paceibacteria bacterium]
MTTILLLQWAIILLVALYALVKGADMFIEGARKIGLYFGMSAFAVGVLIVGMGTSLPELASSLAGVWSGVPEIVIANVVGSNITNILLVVGVLAFFGGRVIIKQDLLKTELPLFFIATAHFGAAVFDGVIDMIEACLLLATFGAYLWYIMVESQHDVEGEGDYKQKEVFFPWPAILLSILGLVAILVGAKFAVDMAVNIAFGFSVPVALVSISAIAIGTSLPELVVTIQAIRNKQTEMGIGNIFGSCAFNVLVVAGFSALFVTLPAGEIVMGLGLGIMLVASAILFVSGLARQVMRWEGLMMLIFFVFFMVKLATMI